MNYIKNNEITQNLVNTLKIIYYNNLLEVNYYNKILSFTDEIIILEKIEIIGNNLKIIYIDKYLIKVNGNIKLIKEKNYAI